jgi:hypothetical protein
LRMSYVGGEALLDEQQLAELDEHLQNENVPFGESGRRVGRGTLGRELYRKRDGRAVASARLPLQEAEAHPRPSRSRRAARISRDGLQEGQGKQRGRRATGSSVERTSRCRPTPGGAA